MMDDLEDSNRGVLSKNTALFLFLYLITYIN